MFGRISLGEPFLFKLHHPENFIVGGGFFAHSSILPVSIAWQSFGEKNGAVSLEEMRHRIEHYRRMPAMPREDYNIGCILLQSPFYLERKDWIPAPGDFHPKQVRRYYLSLTLLIFDRLAKVVLIVLIMVYCFVQMFIPYLTVVM